MEILLFNSFDMSFTYDNKNIDAEDFVFAVEYNILNDVTQEELRAFYRISIV